MIINNTQRYCFLLKKTTYATICITIEQTLTNIIIKKMEQTSTTIFELFEMIFLFGLITYLLGASFQGYILIKNNKSIWTSILIILLTRVLTVPITLFILRLQHYPVSPVFVSVIAILPETIFSLLILKAFGNKIFIGKNAVLNGKLPAGVDL